MNNTPEQRTERDPISSRKAVSARYSGSEVIAFAIIQVAPRVYYIPVLLIQDGDFYFYRSYEGKDCNEAY